MPSERQLCDLLREFARTLVTDYSIQAILDHLVERIVEVLPITGAGVAITTPGSGFRYVAASDAAALCFEELQTELGEGPCVVAYDTGESVVVPDLALDARFPLFAPRATEVGLAAMFTFPLHDGDERLGALDLYRNAPGALSDAAMDSCEILADVASAYLINARAREDLRDLVERSHDSSMRDALTGLPNRLLFMERLDQAVRRCRRSGKIAAVLFADLDHFKQVNDRYGHGVGDELLIAVTGRLAEVLRPGDTLARLAGDEFVILCEDLDDAVQAHAIASRVGTALARPIVLSCGPVGTSASVGIAFSTEDTALPERLLHDADAAMYQAKRKGGGRHQVVDLLEQHLTDERINLERDLHLAETRGELRTEYQPIVETGTGRIIGVEALLRWSHPYRGLVGPDVFVPLAERSGLITEIGRWVLERACRDRQGWKRGRTDVALSVNVSAHQLMSRSYAASVAAILRDTGTDPGDITLEVTESVFVQDSDRALIVLGQLKELGVKLALDDFGTGYSSLNYLHRFPIDIVKIDQMFVADLGQNPTSHAIVGSVVELAHMLGMSVVAEGVETARQHDRLASLACDACQGFYFSRPISAESLVTLTNEHPDERSVCLSPLVGVVNLS